MIKKIIAALTVLALAAGAVFAIVYVKNEKSSDIKRNIISVFESDKSLIRHTFSADIEAVSDKEIAVVPKKGFAERMKSDRLSFSPDEVKITDKSGRKVRADDVMNFSEAEVEYYSKVKNDYPSEIDVRTLVLSSREYCNVYFSVNGKEVETLRVPVGGSVEECDMPNAGAYCKKGKRFDGWTDGKNDVSSLVNITDSITLTAKIVKSGK